MIRSRRVRSARDVVPQHASEELARVRAHIRAHVRQAEARNRAGRFVRVVLAPAEHSGCSQG